MIITCHPKELITLRKLAAVLPENTVINVSTQHDKINCRMVVKQKALEMEVNFADHYRVFTEEERTEFRTRQTKATVIAHFLKYKGGYEVPMREQREFEALGRQWFDVVEFENGVFKVAIRKYSNQEKSYQEILSVYHEVEKLMPTLASLTFRIKEMVGNFQKDYYLRIYAEDDIKIVMKMKDGKETNIMAFNHLISAIQFIQDHHQY